MYYGDNLEILRRYIPDASVDLIYLDPPFNSNRDYNVIFRDESGNRSDAQLLAFEDTWHWGHRPSRPTDPESTPRTTHSACGLALRAEYTTQIRHQPAPSVEANWQNSLMAPPTLVDEAGLSDHGVMLECQLGDTSRRLDAFRMHATPHLSRECGRRRAQAVERRMEFRPSI